MGEVSFTAVVMLVPAWGDPLGPALQAGRRSASSVGSDLRGWTPWI
jgi:hypothetical protein